MNKVSPEIAERWGRALQERRTMRGMTQSALGRALGIRGTAISNMERGIRAPSPENLRLLDSTLQAGGRLERLWKELKNNGQLAWLGKLSELERDAVSLLEYQPLLFPSLLQTEQYARMVMRAISPWVSQEEIDSSADARMARARRFLDSTSPVLVTVLSEQILTTPIDRSKAMVEQLEHVLQLAQGGRVTLQVVPVGKHPGLVGPFKIFAPSEGPEVVYVESAARGQFVDASPAVADFKLRFGHLQAEALSPGQSVDRLKETLEGLTDD
ncbi:helix-turn-helix domain-containing protein [Nocardiopsis sp. CNT-189]|uniref:helix-turn-helix domain-containing protein n=1 Tax=Nocardiopsis oceanisediminis TaxID=2816862 RepID=UPI003B2C93FB